MTKYFDEDDIKNLLVFDLEEDNEDCLENLNKNAASFETERERELYISLIKNINQSINREFREEFIEKIDRWLIENKDLNDIASLYKMTAELAEKDVRNKGRLVYIYYSETDTYPYDYLWEKVDSSLRQNGLKANIKLAYNLKQTKNFQDNQWVWINDTTGKFTKLDSIDDDFNDFLNDWEVEDLLSTYSYDLDDYLEEKQTEGLVL
ncbi:Hypothetical protein MAGb_3000 [Mycoplasmopsis agalactiae 14628]|uniref:Uncharacterized protein n=1 Tax=Mycoplasmopsis agalactiae 14628 TaxID=1110504 RepID=I5D682_MYCAA|nr:hypothetical protein [Mycoplasmopsis agalactiae]EIN15191.1 Hypothetical protein MAGb_3000 [Mycoplasmopsis agalactiae 14628]